MLSSIEQLTGGVYFAVDAEQNVIAFSQGMEALTGRKREEVLGRHCLNAFRCPNCLKGCRLFERGSIDSSEMEFFRSDGSSVEVFKSGRLIQDPELGTYGIEWVRLSRESKNARSASPTQRFDRLLESLNRSFIALDEKFQILQLSRKLPQLLGYPLQELLGLPISQLLGERLLGAESELRTSLLAGERREGLRALLPLKKGTETVSLSAAAVQTPDELTEFSGGCMANARYLLMIRPSEEKQVPHFEGFVTRSERIRPIFRLIDHLHGNDALILITGESGTGKELIAKAIHSRSHRASGPFVTVNCGAIPGDLLESELFGHVRGAFTGAIRDKPGRFQLAEGGTLFLDEIGDLSLPLQVKLLRVLQEGTYEAVGDPHPRRVKARVVAATHRDLALEVRERRFREDLYYRLRVIPIEIPPLRERREDLDLLIQHLLERIGLRRARALRLSPSAMRCLLSHPWPGNVREMENALEYSTAVCEGQTIHENDLPQEIRASTLSLLPKSEPEPPLQEANQQEQAEVQRIRTALRATQGRRQEAAEHLGISRWTLWRKMKEHGIR